MVSKKTFIITIVSMCILFALAIGSLYFYYTNKIQTMIEEKEKITILEQNNEPTGLENVIVE